MGASVGLVATFCLFHKQLKRVFLPFKGGACRRLDKQHVRQGDKVGQTFHLSFVKVGCLHGSGLVRTAMWRVWQFLGCYKKPCEGRKKEEAG